MTDIQPISAVALGTVVFRQLPDVQPFSIVSGYSFEGILSDIRTWLRDVLVPYLNDHGPVTEIVDSVYSSIQQALQEIATADIPVSDALFAAVLPEANSLVRLYLDAHYRDALLIAVDTTQDVDHADAIQAALDTGSNVGVVYTGTGHGIAKIGHTLNMSATQGQRLFTRNATLYPTFLGTAVQMVTRQFIDVEVDGTLQPTVGDTSTSAAIRIGSVSKGYNPQQGSVAGSIVRDFRGDGFMWEDGAMIDFTHAAAYNCTRGGFNTIAANDNNHGFFADTHAVNCGGAGYAIRGNGADLNNGGSRHHVFDDAKGFGCNPNFYIESRSNGGRIFSEVGVTPDHFTANSRGNDFQFHETAASFEGCIDDGAGNRISGFSVNNAWETKELRARTLVVGVNQPVNKSSRITEWISGKYPTGDVAIGANASVVLNPGVSGGGDGRSVDTALFAADAAGYIIQPFFDASGALKFTVLNTQGARTLNGTISYGIKRFA